MNPGDLDRNASALRRAYQASSHGLAFAITLALGIYGGSWLDERWQCSPVFVLLGFAVALGVALVSLIRAVDQLERDDKAAGKKQQ